MKVTAACAIALGTYLGGWRIIRTLGKGLVDITPPQGMAAESTSAAVILSSSQPRLRAVHHPRGHRFDPGLGCRPEALRCAGTIAGRMVAAWAITLPSAGLVGAVMWFIADSIGGAAGAIVISFILVAFSLLMWLRARRAPIGAHNVNDEWEGIPGTTKTAPQAATPPTTHDAVQRGGTDEQPGLWPLRARCAFS